MNLRPALLSLMLAWAMAARAADLPPEALVLETDAPDQPDAEIRGQRNEPARLRTVLDCIAQLRGEPAEAIAAQTSANARRLFGLPA